MKKQKLSSVAPLLVSWYRAHERTFPWREDPSPYRVWVSEIMLQQTRIEAALPYFERFVGALPDVYALANAEEDTVLKLWEGLGYYSRARNLQKAAKTVVCDYGGELPSSYTELLKLPGIGEYTAGAIASIAFGQPVAAVDGNVLRVMARLLDDDRDVMSPSVRKELSALVTSLVPPDDPGGFNEGLMELGETICLPHTMPHCSDCPLAALCAVAGSDRAKDLPTRALPKPRRVEERTVFVVLAKNPKPAVLLHKRPESGLLAGLWELPNALPKERLPIDGITANAVPFKNGKHIFSHVEWRLQGKRTVLEKCENVPEEYAFVSAEEWHRYALPSAFRTYTPEIVRWLNKEEDVQ